MKHLRATMRSIHSAGICLFNLASMADTNAYSAYTGSGNDLVIGGSFGSQTIMVDGDGRRALVLPGTGYDLVYVSTIASIDKLVVTYIGSDAYLTSSDSLYSPVDDPNAIVVIGMTQGSNQNAVETVMTANYYSRDLHDFGSHSSSSTSSMSSAWRSDAAEAGGEDMMFQGSGFDTMHGNPAGDFVVL